MARKYYHPLFVFVLVLVFAIDACQTAAIMYFTWLTAEGRTRHYPTTNPSFLSGHQRWS